jgi:SH3 domain-containing protein
MRIQSFLRAVGAMALMIAAATAARGQQTTGTGVLLTASPMYLFPDSTRTPLTTVPAGATVRVIGREGDWYRVEYRDQYLGLRTGYVLAANVRFEPGAAAPAQPGAQAAPEPAPRRFDRGYVSVNGSYQQESTGFAASTTFRQNVENGTLRADYSGRHPIVADFAVGAHVWNVVDAAVAATWTTQKRDALIVAGIPHPFSFNQLRPVSGTASGVTRQELALHLDAAVVVPPQGRLQLSIFGGPSVFRVEQGVVTSVTANEAYPYDTATFNSATVQTLTRTHVGFNAGADVAVYFSKMFGVGGIVRYSRAHVHFSPTENVDVKVKAGGLQGGAGIRVRF